MPGRSRASCEREDVKSVVVIGESGVLHTVIRGYSDISCHPKALLSRNIHANQPSRCYCDCGILFLHFREQTATTFPFYLPGHSSSLFAGNGPSAITLSYLLSGNVPFYTGGCEDAYVDKKLTKDEPIVLQDIEFLSQVSMQ